MPAGWCWAPTGGSTPASPDESAIVAFTPAGAVAVVADGIEAEHLVVGAGGGSGPPSRGTGASGTCPRGASASCTKAWTLQELLALSPDQALLAVADTATRWVWSFPLAPDGAPSRPAYYRLEMEDETAAAGTGGMTVDSGGFLYVATRRSRPSTSPAGSTPSSARRPPAPSGVVFAGKDLDTLYVTAGNKLFRRRPGRKGVLPCSRQPPTPRL